MKKGGGLQEYWVDIFEEEVKHVQSEHIKVTQQKDFFAHLVLILILVRHYELHCLLEQLPEGPPLPLAESQVLALDHVEELVKVDLVVLVLVHALEDVLLDLLEKARERKKCGFFLLHMSRGRA